jgi:hypothetical protein
VQKKPSKGKRVPDLQRAVLQKPALPHRTQRLLVPVTPETLKEMAQELLASLKNVATEAENLAGLDLTRNGKATLPAESSLAIALRGLVVAREENDDLKLDDVAARLATYVKRVQDKSTVKPELPNAFQHRKHMAVRLVRAISVALLDVGSGRAGAQWRAKNVEEAAACLVERFRIEFEYHPNAAASIICELPSPPYDWSAATKSVQQELEDHPWEAMARKPAPETAVDNMAERIVQTILRALGYPPEKVDSFFDAERKALKPKKQ